MTTATTLTTTTVSNPRPTRPAASPGRPEHPSGPREARDPAALEALLWAARATARALNRRVQKLEHALWAAIGRAEDEVRILDWCRADLWHRVERRSRHAQDITAAVTRTLEVMGAPPLTWTYG